MGSEITLHGDRWGGGRVCEKKREDLVPLSTWADACEAPDGSCQTGSPRDPDACPRMQGQRGAKADTGSRLEELEGGGQAEAVRSGEGVGQTAQGQQGQAGSLRGLSRISGATQESHLVGLRNPGESGCPDCPGEELQDTTGCRNIRKHLYRTGSRVSVWMPGRQRHTCSISQVCRHGPFCPSSFLLAADSGGSRSSRESEGA